jgi:hypothetical protein
VPTPTTDVGPGGPGCLPPDTSNGPDSAYEVTAADIAGSTLLRDTLCPKFDDDYWHVTVSGERQIIILTTDYRKSGSFRLANEWLGPKKLCMPSPATSCSVSADCAGGGFCDPARGGCRANDAGLCYAAGHCDTTEACTVGGVEVLAKTTETGDTAAQHHLRTAVSAFIPGDYYARVFDDTNSVEDAKVEYELRVEMKQDPDIYEPNNDENLATDLTSLMTGGTVTLSGYFSYVADEDWFVFDPSVAPLNIVGPPVVLVDLSWQDGSLSLPSWTLDRGGRVFPAPTQVIRGGGKNTLRSTLVMPSAGPLLLHVLNTNNVTDDASGYSLTVTVTADAYETTVRNDDPNSATVMNVGNPVGGSIEHTESLVSQNDVDWYRVDRAAGVTDNTLLQIHAESAAPSTAPYLLDVQVYRRTGADCASGVCSNSGRCLTIENKCIAPWIYRPSDDLYPGQPDSESREFGGPTPNIIDVQVPVTSGTQGALYVLVQQIPQAATGVVGFSPTIPYKLTLTHKAEPDPGDRTNEDSCYVARPLADTWTDCLAPYATHTNNEWTAGAQRPAFYRAARNVDDDGTNESAPAGAGQSWALVTGIPAPTRFIAPDDCAQLTFAVYDEFGGTGSGSFSVTAASGTLYTDDMCTTPLGGAPNLPTSAPVYYKAPATSGTDTITVGSTPSYLAIAATQPNLITMSGATNAIVGSPSAAITATLTHAVTPAAAVILRARVLNGPPGVNSIECQAENVGGHDECPDIDNGLQTAGGCPQSTGDSDCSLPISVPVPPATVWDYKLNVVPAARGLVLVEISAPGYVPATWVVAGTVPGIWSYSTTFKGTGYISYEGDNDFFAIPAPAFGKGHMTATLTYSGPVHVRANITRGDAISSYCGSGYGCGIGVEGSACSPCNAPTDDPCNFVFNNVGGTWFNIWVNGENNNRRDDLTPYTFTFTFVEGCPAICSAYICGQ